MKNKYNDYLDNKIKLETYQRIGVIFLIIAIAGLIGWCFEFIFYYFNFGMKTFYFQGGNFLPWINIYAIGAVIIMGVTYKIKRKPVLVFFTSALSAAILEYFSGLMIYKLRDGLRLWDYNTEILNFGNIGGFVCLRSFLCFGIAALLLVYFLLPKCIILSKKMNKKTFMILTIGLFSIIMFDELYNLIFARILDLPRARDLYTKLGIHYMNYRKK